MRHIVAVDMQKKVVIVGGGFAGTYVARKLQNHYSVTLIDSKDYFEFTPSVLRTIVEPQHIKKIQSKHSDYLQKTVLIRENVRRIGNGEVITLTHAVTFDYLVICTGSSYRAPLKDWNTITATRAQELVGYADRLKQSNSVLVVGGGLVGVELAAEIIGKYPSKKVTIIQASNELIERNPIRARKYAYNFLSKRKVNMIFNEIVIGKQGRFYFTDKKRQLTADIAFICTGIIPNSKHLKVFFRSSLDSRGFLKVNKFLQVGGFQNIFAAGDVTAILEEKTAQNAEKHAAAIAENIEALDLDRSMKEYVSKPRITVISLGKWNGIIVYKNLAIAGLMAAFAKWFVEWKTMIDHKP